MAVNFSNIDLQLRSEQTPVLNATQHDQNHTALEDACNTLLAWARARLVVREAYAAANANVTLSANNTWYSLGSILTAGHGNNLAFANNNFEVVANGVYRVTGALSYQGLNNTVMRLGFAVDGVVDAQHGAQRFTSSNDVGSMGFTGFVTANAGNNIQPVVLAVPGGNTGNIVAILGSTFVVERVQ